MEVTLAQMLRAREIRAERQIALNRAYGTPIISFSMNIPGPVKDTPMIRRGFRAGLDALDALLQREKIRSREVYEAATGCEALYAVDMDAVRLKSLTTRIEDEHGLGRLFDMDVLDVDLRKLDREAVGGGSRNCIVCGAAGRGCASRRLHNVDQLQAAVRDILTKYFMETESARIGALAVKALLAEVETTPKPGLVDRRNNGSHRDMNIRTFYASAEALSNYFRDCVRIGMESAAEEPGVTFRKLRISGLQAEKAMYAATNGVNTHKGAVFTLGILCGAAGRLWEPEGEWHPEKLFREVSAMTREIMEEDWRRGGDTVGYRLYSRYGIRGIRGEASEGLPSVAQIGLPTYHQCLCSGMDANDAGVWTLLALIANVQDTNMIARGGLEGAREASEKTADLLKTRFTMADVEMLDDWFIGRNLSPGGCADLLAAVYFIYSLSEKKN